MSSLPDPDRARRRVGATLLAVCVLAGAVLLVVQFLVPPLFTPEPWSHYRAMLAGALLAFPAGIVYLTVPRLLDRYDPEPWYALVGALLWGGIAAASFSAPINTCMGAFGSALGGAAGGDVMMAVVSAPIVEEFWKALGIWGLFFFLKREFDGLVDGVIYATFIALGFATVENVIYYARAAQEGQGLLAATFLMRGVLGPWGHPLYTSMTGLGFGLARETKKPAVRVLAPLGGYVVAVLLHMIWNGSATFAGAAGAAGGVVFLVMLPVWFCVVAAFMLIVVLLVRRRGRILRAHLEDEVALGTIDRAELELVTSAFGALRARLRHGRRGEEFVRAVARLALSKWHATRAYESQTQTVSVGFIVPLRQHIAALRR